MNSIVSPCADCLENGAKYYFEIERQSPTRRGRISDEHGTLLWRYSAAERYSGRRLSNPFNKADFVLENLDGHTELIVRRASLLPPVFQLMNPGRVVGTILLTSPLRNRYAIRTGTSNSWTFHMPLFRVLFRGGSESRTDIWAAVGPSETEWSVLIRPGAGDLRLVTALAFIHHERWHYG